MYVQKVFTMFTSSVNGKAGGNCQGSAVPVSLGGVENQGTSEASLDISVAYAFFICFWQDMNCLWKKLFDLTYPSTAMFSGKICFMRSLQWHRVVHKEHLQRCQDTSNPNLNWIWPKSELVQTKGIMPTTFLYTACAINTKFYSVIWFALYLNGSD